MNSYKSNQEKSIELDQVLAHYDLGVLKSFELNQRGFVNTGFSIETEKNGILNKYFLRKYKPGIHKEELLFEHHLINHLSQHSTLPVARLHRTLNGSTYFQRRQKNLDPPTCYYAIFDHLSGEDRFTWVNPHCNQPEIICAAGTLAQFHSAVTTLQPKGKRYEPGIYELLTQLTQTVEQSLKHSKDTSFDDFLLDSQEAILQNIQDILSILRTPDACQMPQIVIHCDFHPGNLKFQGETVSGLFDFDWSKVDYRSFDLGLAIWYFFAEWENKRDGRIRTEDARNFLREYRKTMRMLPGIGDLTPTEQTYLPIMINAGNLYVLNWTILDYYNKNVDPIEYLKYLLHSINSIHWYQESQYHNLVEE